VVDSGGAGLFPAAPWMFVLRNVAIGLIVTGLALRYFYVAHEWRRSVELRAAARVLALQARIRPHFLFNSMNTIAALTRSNPPRAEEAVQDLADLFRATLADKGTITLAEELEVARTYQRMEQLRLGARLQVEWRTDALPADALVPGLVIQPLLENAIYLANIRERLSLMYGERALMKSGRFDAEYIVTLRFPLIEKPAQVAAAARA